jgi:hypothetical protein
MIETSESEEEVLSLSLLLARLVVVVKPVDSFPKFSSLSVL